ncbi:Gene 25-like lysozyme (plasmid) [Candidatus Trichorickettsia mobilis]|uniref:type VI secretion system baseplate subunit TssE n=1 Tax=Candidatus Trichorickettsia mobilis TaxID=1346319 RepID=UPI002B262773|nr:type VI secretion system baseplate subunit TssE [Candidatus Trichorickettsia mobilis]WPY01669.1 Gene 25-like lysozyme [Candidatus Trichorickettsia mobilis]
MYKKGFEQSASCLSSLERFFGIKKTDQENFINSVVADLSNLLNAHPLYSEPPEEKLDMNIVHYGLPGLHIYSAYSSADQIKVSDLIKLTIERFEPRLHDIKVSPIIPELLTEAVLSFRISAKLSLPRYLIPIVLESRFTTNPYKVFLTINNIE